MSEYITVGSSLAIADLNSVREAYYNVLRHRRRLMEAKDAAGVHGVDYDKIGSRTLNYESRIENDSIRIVQREQALRVAELEMEAAQLRLCVKLFEVEDVRTRLILKCRYVDLMNWKQVSAEVGGGESDSVDAVKKTNQRFVSRLNREN